MKRWRGVLFALVCVFWLLMVPVACYLAMMSPFLSDAGVNAAVWMLILNFVTWPLACLLAPIAGLIAYKKGHRRAAWIIVALPLLWIAVAVGGFAAMDAAPRA